MKFSTPKSIAALALIALAALIAFALLAHARAADAHTPPQVADATRTPTPTPSAAATRPDIEFVDGKDAFPDISRHTGNVRHPLPQSDAYALNQQTSGPTFTFPDGFPRELQDGYRALFADIHAFSQSRFGVSADTAALHITIELENSTCGRLEGWQDEPAYIFINQQCKDSSGMARAVFAHEYFHALQPLPTDTPLWMIEGSAQYFMYLWLDYASIASYNDSRTWTIDRVSEATLPPLGSSEDVDSVYHVGFLAIDYLAEQTGETAPVDYFIVERRTYSEGPTFEETFASVFGISHDAFYRYFAAHRAAGFPQPGAPFESPTPTTIPTLAPIVLEGRIAFSSEREGNNDVGEIYVMNADGTGVSRLTYRPGDDGPEDSFSPVWSPDGQRIAFSSYRNWLSDIYVMNADGTGVSRLTDGSGYSFDPTWSPDGQRIAFSHSRDGDFYEIYVMNADGTEVSRLTYENTHSSSPVWSPDGQRIAFALTTDGDQDVHVMNSDGSNLTNLTNHQAADWSPAWSPDGRRIAFVSARNHISKIYVMNADGSQQTRLTQQTGYHGYPTYSPDGQYIAFNTQRDGNYEIYVMNADGSNPTRITNHPGQDSDPDWTSAAEQGPVSPTPTHTPTATPTHTPTATPVIGGQIDNRVSQLEGQVSALQALTSAQQTQIGLMEQLIAALQTLIQSLTNRITALESDTPQPTATATPTPTPTSAPGTDPTPVTANACIQPIQPNSTIIGTWTTDCLSANTPPDGSSYYAKFYTFTLDAASDVAISLNADERIYLYLLEGAGTDGNILQEPDAAGSHIVRMTQTLNAGSYTIEVTTWRPETLGDFILTLTTTE